MPPYQRRRTTVASITNELIKDDGLKHGDSDDATYPDKDSSIQKREYFKAAGERINYLALTGALVPRDEVNKLFIEVGSVLRQALEELPDRLSSQVAVLDDTEEIHSVILEEVRRVSRVIRAQEQNVTGSQKDTSGQPGDQAVPASK